jgi:hypothetical protein
LIYLKEHPKLPNLLLVVNEKMLHLSRIQLRLQQNDPFHGIYRVQDESLLNTENRIVFENFFNSKSILSQN